MEFDRRTVRDTRNLIAELQPYASPELDYVLDVLDYRLKDYGSGKTMYEVLNLDIGGDDIARQAAPGEANAAEAPTLAAFPNPFRGATSIRYVVESRARVRVAVYDGLGRLVAVPFDGEREPGVHYATFSASGLAVGTYVGRVTVGDHVRTVRLQYLGGG